MKKKFTWLERFIGRKKDKRRSRISTQSENQAVLPYLDAARLHRILRNAENGDTSELFDLYRDFILTHGHTQTEFSKRKLAVLSEAQRLVPNDAEDAAQVKFAEAIEKHLVDVKGWQDSLIHLLDSTLYPVSVVEKIYRPSGKPGWRYELAELRPVPYRLLNFTTGELRIEEADEEGRGLNTYHRPDPLRYIVYRGHLFRSQPDTWGGPMRAVLFWGFFATQTRDWWARFLDRFGTPFLEGTYDEGDEDARYSLQNAFSAATRLMGIVHPDDTAIEIHQTNTTDGGDAFQNFHGAANAEISKIILGQTLSAEGQNLGLGGGQASVQEGVRDDIRSFDRNQLSFVVSQEIIVPLFRLNSWGISPPTIHWGGADDDRIENVTEVLNAATTSGLRLTEKGLKTFNKTIGLEFEVSPNSPTPPAEFPLAALSAREASNEPAIAPQDAREAIDSLAATGAPDFADALAGTLQPLQELAAGATSLSDLESKLATAMPALDHTKAARIAETVLTSAAANAALTAREK